MGNISAFVLAVLFFGLFIVGADFLQKKRKGKETIAEKIADKVQEIAEDVKGKVDEINDEK